MSTHIGKQAVVIGAGMGGLTAARALADHFDRVVVLENDSLPSEPAPRPGTPQAKHAHALLAGGQQALNSLLPGFEDDLAKAGAVPLRISLDLRFERPGYDPFPQRDLGISIFSASRPLIECTVRKRVAETRNIEFHACCKAQQLLITSDRSRVTSVRCEHADGTSQDLPADLVIDSSGHGLLTLNLLESIGLPLEETTIGVDIGYSTAFFEIPADAPSDWKALFTVPDPTRDSRGVFVFPAEGNRWVVTGSGRYDQKPPDNEAGYFEHLGKLRTATAQNAIRGAKRITDFVRYGFKGSRRRHFHRVPAFPVGLLPFGDTMCRFNPVYGQGMTVAAQEACLLRHLLGEQITATDGLDSLSSNFLGEAQAILETPWATAAIPDFLDSHTEGQRPPDLENVLKFSGALFKLASDDPAVHKLITEVQHLLKPQSVYNEPSFARRVEAAMAAHA